MLLRHKASQKKLVSYQAILALVIMLRQNQNRHTSPTPAHFGLDASCHPNPISDNFNFDCHVSVNYHHHGFNHHRHIFYYFEYHYAITVSTTSTYTETDTASTTTTSTVTSGIATSSGFLPIESTLNDPPSKLKKRLAGHPHGPLEGRDQVSKGQGCAGNNYAAAVSCIDYIQVRSKVTFVLTTKTSTKTLPTSTVTATSTTVSTSTSTVVPPDVSTTLSFSTTIPITITSTFQETATTTTTTTFTVTSTLTQYDACATNNLLGPIYNGGTIDNLYQSGNGAFAISSANSAYDCCVACITSTTCAASAFLASSNRCYQMNLATCSSSQAHSGRFVYASSGQSPSVALVVSNSNCGYVTDGGVGG